MSEVAVVLILISALAHVAWNAIGKRQVPSAAFFVAALSAAGIVLLPLPVMLREKFSLIPAAVWGLIVVTGLFQAFYFGMLAAAYRKGDMSVAYPMARAIPILLVAGFTRFIANGTEISSYCLGGMTLIVGGSFLLPVKKFSDLRASDYLNGCGLCALLAAIGTAGYSLTDDVALRQLRGLPGTPFSATEAVALYAPLQVYSTLFFLLVYVLAWAPERRLLREVFAVAKMRAAMVGVGIYASYGLVLGAMAFVSNVSYIVAFRQLSIPMGAAFGILVFKEPRHLMKGVGVGAVFAGVLLVAIG